MCRAPNPLCCPTKHSVRSSLLTHIAAQSTLHTEQCLLGVTVVPTLQVPPRNTASSWAWLCLSPKLIHVLLLLLYCHSVFQYQIPKGKKISSQKCGFCHQHCFRNETGFAQAEEPLLCTPPSPVCFALCGKSSSPLWRGEQTLPELQTGSRFSSVSHYWNCMVSTGAALPDSLEAVCQFPSPGTFVHLFPLRLCPPNHRCLQ